MCLCRGATCSKQDTAMHEHLRTSKKSHQSEKMFDAIAQEEVSARIELNQPYGS